MHTARSVRQQSNRQAVNRCHDRLKHLCLAAVPAAFVAAFGISSLPVAAAPFTLTGNATINGQPTTYTMYLTDDPANGDNFYIQTSSGYNGSGRLIDGDISFLR